MKAQGISMSMLVVAAIAVMVLLVVGVFFSGGFRQLGTSMMGFVSGTTDEDSSTHATVCSTWCINTANMPEGQYFPRPSGYCHSSIDGDSDTNTDCDDADESCVAADACEDCKDWGCDLS